MKESLGLYIFRLLLNIAFFAVAIMIYWSSLLVEQDLKKVQKNIDEIKYQISSLQSNKVNFSQPVPIATVTVDSQIDPNLPNLLTDDLFYSETLPKMLGADFKPSGIRKEATIGKPQNLQPFSNWAQVSTWITMCSGGVASQHFGIYETFAPEMATKMELRHRPDGQPEYWIHLRRDIFWQPLKQDFFPKEVKLAQTFFEKHLVTAHDFKFYFDAIMNPHVGEASAVALRMYYGDIKEIEVIDDFTFVVRWKTEEIKDEEGNIKPQMKYSAKMWTAALRPLPSFVYKYFQDGSKIVEDDSNPDTYRNHPVWAQNFSQHWANNIIVSCGPWIFNGMTDREIRFVRNPEYFSPYTVLAEGLEIVFKDSTNSVWEEFKSGSLDLLLVPASQLPEVERFLKSDPYKEQEKRGLGIKRLDYVDRSYSYVAWNEVNPLFQSKKVRQALTMSIDRKRIIEQNLNGMGVETTGTFFRYSPSYDESIVPYPYDPSLASKLLAEEGWYDSEGRGIIEKEINGKRLPFKFNLTYYVKNLNSKSISEYISTALREVGIVANLEGVDLADLSAAVDNKSFEALFLAWALGTPPESPRQVWYTSTEKGSSNTIGFSNKEIDSIIDKLEYEYDPEKRLELYHKFDKILYDESPYVFLYTPKATLIYRDYLQNVFIPADRQDLVPGANVGEPQSNIYWIKK